MLPAEPYNRELLTRISAGDEAAFATVFHEFYPLLATHIHNITRDFELTQEIVQDVFLKIWMSRETLIDINDFKGYLWIMAKNHALNALDKIVRERSNRAIYAKSLTADEEPAENTYMTLLDEAIAQLPEQQKKVYLLSRRDRLKQADIATELNVTVSTVKKYLQLATEFIREYLLQRIGRSASVVSLVLLMI